MPAFTFVLLMLASVASAQTGTEPSALFASVGLTPEQRAAIDRGQPVAKVLPWGDPSEMYVFGAVYIDASRAAYMKLARDISRLAAAPGYLGIGEVPASASVADLRAVTLDAGDLKALKSCREGACSVQLPAESIQGFHDRVDWSQPDAADRANELAREMMLDLIRQYRRVGNLALGVYRSKDHPFRVANQFETIVSRYGALPDMTPELRRYLLQYPDAALPAADTFFYWEKVNFGLKPTIRVNHAVMYSTDSADGPMSVVAIKQLYASHYFHTALDMSVCIDGDQQRGQRGFYLITLKSSQQDGLDGVKGSLVRKAVVDKSRTALERVLDSIKSTLEHAAPGH